MSDEKEYNLSLSHAEGLINRQKEEIEQLKNGLKYIAGFHIRGEADRHLKVIRDIALEFLGGNPHE